MNNYLIYKHTSPSGNSYIGQTKNLKKREYAHKTNNNSCTAFSNAIKKYGWDNLTHEILIEGLSLEEANYWEEYYIREHNTLIPNGYNLTTGGLNYIRSEETCKKISISKLGKPQSLRTEEHCKNLSISKVGHIGAMLGKKHSEESIQLMKKPKTEQHKQHLRQIQQQVSCPHCGKKGGIRLMKRWHFNNCKYK